MAIVAALRSKAGLWSGSAATGAPGLRMPDFTVECRNDPHQGEVPARFGWPGRMHGVLELIDRWEGEEDIYFRVRADDDATYILRRNRDSGEWQIHFFRDDGEP